MHTCESGGSVRHPASSDEPLYDFARMVAEVTEALVTTWSGATRATAPPRLSALQWQALVSARRSPGVNLTHLAEQVGTTMPATSRLCDRLEAAGLLRRDVQPASRREIRLFLTRRGHEAVDALLDQRTRAIHDILIGMAADRREELLSGLTAFSRAVSATPEGRNSPDPPVDGALRQAR